MSNHVHTWLNSVISTTRAALIAWLTRISAPGYVSTHLPTWLARILIGSTQPPDDTGRKSPQ
jgi:hypothetical protein